MKKTKALGTFEILKETNESYVKLDVDMSPEMYAHLIKRGKEVAKKNPQHYVSIGFRSLIEQHVDQVK